MPGRLQNGPGDGAPVRRRKGTSAKVGRQTQARGLPGNRSRALPCEAGMPTCRRQRGATPPRSPPNKGTGAAEAPVEDDRGPPRGPGPSNTAARIGHCRCSCEGCYGPAGLAARPRTSVLRDIVPPKGGVDEHDMVGTFSELRAHFLDRRWTPPAAPLASPKGDSLALLNSFQGPELP